ncbi:MAG TPA: flagellar basal body P-ring protein FlgI, partial [Gemmataceae bacterium]|nr:flagellar basal body P-ring protein FlgI [Gemmataceae bacterium]
MYRIMGALSLSCLLLTGCIDSQTRMKIAEETEKENDLGVATIRDITEIGPGSDAPMQVSGVGLITGLAGTGHSPNGPYRDILEQYLLKHNTTRGGEMAHDGTDIKVRKILDNPNNALVIVTGFIPPGAHKGDRFDVDIKLPPASKTSSLAGGYLQLCTLRVYAAASDLSGRSQYANSQKLLAGHIVAHAKGRLFTGFGNNADSHELKHARVWQAGVSRVARPYSFVMRDDRKSLGIASDVARRINFMYQEDPNSPARRFEFNQQENRILAMGLAANQLNQNQDPYGIHANDVAKASKECIIHVRVPAIYRFDHERFQRVACLTPLRDNDPNLNRYRQRLQAMVLNPRECQRAA